MKGSCINIKIFSYRNYKMNKKYLKKSPKNYTWKKIKMNPKINKFFKKTFINKILLKN